MTYGQRATAESYEEDEIISDLAHHKETVQSFLDLVFNGKRPEEAFAKYVGAGYIQHNPHAPEGSEASAKHLAGFVSQAPGLSLEIKRVIAEGDLVVTHGLLKFSPEDRGSAFADIMRLKDGKIVEHWDVVQEVPENPANDNSMF